MPWNFRRNCYNRAGTTATSAVDSATPTREAEAITDAYSVAAMEAPRGVAAQAISLDDESTVLRRLTGHGSDL